MTNSIWKSRDITCWQNVCIIKPVVFPAVMDPRESWTIKKAEHRGIDAFELWCWRRLLWVSWTARRSSQSILKEISPEYSLEGLMLSWSSNTLATWCKELTHWKRTWCWEIWRAGGEGDNRGWDGWTASSVQWSWVWARSRRQWRIRKPGVLHSMGSQRVGYNWATEQQHFPVYCRMFNDIPGLWLLNRFPPLFYLWRKQKIPHTFSDAS